MNEVSDESFKKSAIDRMNKILDLVDGDYKKALFIACGSLQETEGLLVSAVEVASSFLNILPQPKKKRGRPEEVCYPDNIGKRGLQVHKKSVRNIKKQNPRKIGAPQKYYYGEGVSTKDIANIIRDSHNKTPEIKWRAVTRKILIDGNLFVSEQQVKQLADLASRVDLD